MHVVRSLSTLAKNDHVGRLLNHARTHVDNNTEVARTPGLSQTLTGEIRDISKREKLKELQSSADQPEICKTRRHKPEQTENKQDKQKPTNKFACSSLRWKTPVKKQMISLTPVQCSPASNARDVFHQYAQITHDAPPHCRDSWTKALCREICSSQHQPWCFEPLQLKDGHRFREILSFVDQLFHGK